MATTHEVATTQLGEEWSLVRNKLKLNNREKRVEKMKKKKKNTKLKLKILKKEGVKEVEKLKQRRCESW